MRITFISPDYPRGDSNAFVFVEQLVNSISSKGFNCFVISPNGAFPWRFLSTPKLIFEERNGVQILRPRFMIVPLFLHIGNLYLYDWLRKRSVNKTLNSLDIIPDVIYCHFWPSANDSFDYSYKHNIPLFVASGESSIKKLFRSGLNNKKLHSFVKGVICVSSKNKNESLALGLATEEKCVVIPNAIDSSLFYVRSKTECRQKLGIPQDVFIIAFVGWFSERKGSKRVSQAINQIDEDVYSFFIGSGSEEPDCKNILYKGTVSHDNIPIYLNAADVFVLPTLQEGCCNAIVEAMACGLPIISSDRDFNKDILNTNNSILVDPTNIDEISRAILNVKNNDLLRKEMSKASLEIVSSLTIKRRAESVLNFINLKM